MAVSEAIKNGRLVRCVVRDQFDQPKIADEELADQEWLRNTDSVKRANAGGGVDRPRPLTDALELLSIPQPPARAAGAVRVVEHSAELDSVATSTERLKSAQADLAELKRDAERAELVPARDVERRLIAVFTACKTRLLAIPSRYRQALPHLVTADVVALENLIREALEDLAEAPREVSA